MNDDFSSTLILVRDFIFATVVTFMMGALCTVPVGITAQLIKGGNWEPCDTWRCGLAGLAMFGGGLWVYYIRKTDELERRLSEAYRDRDNRN